MSEQNTTAPSVQRRYSTFIPTTSCSAPVLRIGTQGLTRTSRSARSLCIEATGSPVPCKSPVQIHAAFEPSAAWAGLQGSAQTHPETITTPGSDTDDTISAFHRRFACARLSGPYL